ALADTTKHPEVGLEQREQTLGPILMDLSSCIFLLRVIDELVPIALERPITAGRVCIEPTARSDGEVRRRLHRLHREILGRLNDDRPLTTDPGDDRGSIFVIKIGRASCRE